MLISRIGNIHNPGSNTLISIGYLTLSENAITRAGNIPKINVNNTIAAVGKNTNKDNQLFFL